MKPLGAEHPYAAHPNAVGPTIHTDPEGEAIPPAQSLAAANQVIIYCYAIHPFQPMPTYLNQFGRQSSLLSHDSPSVKRPVTQPLHFGEFGQLKKGMCW